MSDLISRQAAILAIEEYADRLQMVNWKENPGVPYKAHALNWAINTLRDLPSAQPEHGRWIHEVDTGADMLKCSECNCRVVLYWYKLAVGTAGYEYCPYCGARMDEEEEDGQTG